MRLELPEARIREWQASDVDALMRHANDIEVARQLRDAFPHPYTLSHAEAWFAHCAALEPCTAFAIEVDGEAVGGIGLKLQQDIYRRSAELGYWLGRDHWSKGIMSRAVAEFTAWSFDAFDLIRIYAVTFEDNPASVRVLEKAGFIREGRLRSAAVKGGETLDCLLYATLSPTASRGRERKS